MFDQDYVFHCPCYGSGNFWISTYGYNWLGLLNANSGPSSGSFELTGLSGARESEVKSPSDMIAIADAFEGSSDGRLQASHWNLWIARNLPYGPPPPGWSDVATEFVQKN